MNLRKVGGELGLLILARGHILMRGHHLTPGPERTRHRTLNGRTQALPLLVAQLLIEAEAEKLVLHLVHFLCLNSGNGGQEAPSRIEGAIGIVAREGCLVRPTVAVFTTFTNEA